MSEKKTKPLTAQAANEIAAWLYKLSIDHPEIPMQTGFIKTLQRFALESLANSKDKEKPVRAIN